MRLIDADAALETIDRREKLMIGDKRVSVESIKNFVNNRPTIDAEPVVRCKDCIHRGFDDCPMCHDEYSYDEDDGANYWTVDNTVDDGFCHKGEKMDGGADNA